MQSSAMNCFPVRLKASIHSATVRWCGPAGARPTCERSLVAVDKGEAAEARLLAALAPTAREQAHRCADPAGEEEAGAEGSGSEHRQLGAHVRGLADLAAQVLDGVGELLPLGLDLAAELILVLS